MSYIYGKQVYRSLRDAALEPARERLARANEFLALCIEDGQGVPTKQQQEDIDAFIDARNRCLATVAEIQSIRD